MKTELIEDRATKVARAFADSGSFDPINREALVRDMALELVVFACAELTAICEENARLKGLLWEVVQSSTVFEDTRIGYEEIQIDTTLWDEIKAALSAEPGETVEEE